MSANAAKANAARQWLRGGTLLLSLTAAVIWYLVWASRGANPLVGAWTLSGQCLRPNYDWLPPKACWVGVVFGANPRALLMFAEKNEELLMGYEADYPLPKARSGVLAIKPRNYPGFVWRFQRRGRDLRLQLKKGGPWLTFTRGHPTRADANFKTKPNRGGLPPPKPQPSRLKNVQPLSDSTPTPAPAKSTPEATPAKP